MKKKLFTLLTLLVMCVTGVWADDTYTVSFTNSNWPQSTANYFTSVGSKNNPNSNYAGKYNGTTYDKGLKMETDTKVQFTTTRSFDITIVRSTKKNSGKTINFGTATGTKSALTFGSTLSDDNNADVAVSTLTNLDAGTYQIVRGDGETGIVYVSVTEKGEDTTLKLSVKGATSRSMIKGSESAIEVEAANASGSETYQWYRTNSSDTGCESGTAITGKTTTSYTPNEEEEGTYYYYCVVTDGDKTAKTSLITVAITAPRTGWVVFDGIVDTELRATTVTYNNVSMTYATSASDVTDVSGKTNNTTGRPYQKGISLAKSTDNGGGYLSFTIPTGYKATSFTWAFSGTGGRTIILASAKINSTSAEGYITTLASVSGSNHIVGGTYTTELAAGTYYIRECNGGGWQIDELAFTLTETNDPPAAIIFDPATDSSVEAESEITLASAGATTIMYQWGSSVVDDEGDWSSAETYSEENKPEVPAYGSSNNILSVKASNTHGDTYGSATYTITAPTYTITYAAGGGSGTMAATTGITSGNDQTLTANTFTRTCYTFANWVTNVDVTINNATVTAGSAIANGATIQNVTSNITLTAQWTPVYSTSLDFAAVTLAKINDGTNPPAIATFLAGGNMVAENLGSNSGWETGSDWGSTIKTGFLGYKLKNEGAKVSFLAPAGKLVTIVFGSIAANVTLSKNGTTSTISSKSGDDAETIVTPFVTGEDMLVSLTTTSGGTVTLKKIIISDYATATISAAKYATFYNAEKALDFSTTGITVYTAQDKETSVGLTEITSGQVPANTPVVLYKEGADGTAINVPVIASADDPEGTNDLRVSTGTDVDHMYVLAMNPTIGFYPWTGTNLPAGKIYLQGKASYGARSFIGFDSDTTTAIDNVVVKTIDVNAPMYNLAGQRVNKSYKGVVIVNGKKMLNK